MTPYNKPYLKLFFPSTRPVQVSKPVTSNFFTSVSYCDAGVELLSTTSMRTGGKGGVAGGIEGDTG